MKTYLITTKELSVHINADDCIWGDVTLVLVSGDRIVAKFMEWNSCIDMDFVKEDGK